MDIEFVEGNQTLLDWIKPLWTRLNTYHRHKSVNFVAYYTRLTFPQRKASLINKALDGLMRVDLVKLKEADPYIAYSVTTISAAHEGEIESIFVDEPYRRMGVGDALMKRSLEWLERHTVKVRRVAVANGNEEAAEFYQRYGFYPKMIILEQVDQKLLVQQPEGLAESKHGSPRARKKK